VVKRPVFEEFLKGGAGVHVRQTGEVIDAREDKTWKGRGSGDEGWYGPKDREDVYQGRKTSVRNEQAAYIADAGRPKIIDRWPCTNGNSWSGMKVFSFSWLEGKKFP